MHNNFFFVSCAIPHLLSILQHVLHCSQKGIQGVWSKQFDSGNDFKVIKTQKQYLGPHLFMKLVLS